MWYKFFTTVCNNQQNKTKMTHTELNCAVQAAIRMVGGTTQGRDPMGHADLPVGGLTRDFWP